MRGLRLAMGIGLWGLSSVAASACSGRSVSESPSTVTVHVPQADEWLFGPAQADEPMFLMFLPLVQASREGEIEGRLTSWLDRVECLNQEESEDRRMYDEQQLPLVG